MRSYRIFGAVIFTIGIGHAMDIQGTISSTLVLSEDSQLVGDVTCTVQGAECINMGAPNIRLALNGFTMTGQGNPPNGCLAGGPATNVERGIVVGAQSKVQILGPGMIQGFRGWGIFLNGSTQASVSHVTVSSNCLSGIQVIANNNDLEGNICVRNGSTEAGCGGICLTNSNNNRLRRNVTSGNGYAVMNVVNFGLALEGTSNGNVFEGNTVVGNVNGIWLQAAAANNVVRRNNIMGNPPIGIAASVAGFLGFDIRNLAPDGANTFENNRCSTYSGDSGAGPAPCPNIPKGQ
jgi:parallel beta-helix repeat protein